MCQLGLSQWEELQENRRQKDMELSSIYISACCTWCNSVSLSSCPALLKLYALAAVSQPRCDDSRGGLKVLCLLPQAACLPGMQAYSFYVCLYRSKVEIRCPRLLLSTLFFWDKISPELTISARLAGNQACGICLSLSPAWGLQMCAVTLAFNLGTRASGPAYACLVGT